ncbi:MAG: hypothetical protein H7226_01325 [Salinibacterium sp.]|nr:hypothetical protein [Salinibacterium sp.]
MAKAIRQYGSDKGTAVAAPTTAEEVAKFHMNADTDVRGESIHHTIGAGETQSSPGNHTHDGGTSPLLLSGLTISGSRGGNTSLPSIIACLVRLGAIDSSSA